MGELPYEKGRSMSHYPQAKLNELAEILAEEHADLKPEPGTGGKKFRAAYDCMPIFFYDRVLWVSEGVSDRRGRRPRHGRERCSGSRKTGSSPSLERSA